MNIGPRIQREKGHVPLLREFEPRWDLTRGGENGVVPVARAWARRALILKCLVCLGLLAIAPRLAADQEYEVVGHVTYQSFIADVPKTRIEKDFKVSVRGCAWLIRTSDPGESKYYDEKGFDGVNLFNLHSTFKVDKGEKRDGISATIEQGVLPDDDTSLVNYVWLAYASACYFSGATNGLLLPICCLDDRELRDEHWKTPALWETAHMVPSLPSMVNYLNDGYERNAGPQGRTKTRISGALENGYTNAVYEAGNTTNVLGLSIPKEFDFHRYYVSSYERGELKVRTHIHGAISQLSTSISVSSFMPAFQGTVLVRDRRFRTASPPAMQVPYEITNGKWLNESNSISAYKEELKHDVAAQHAASPTRYKPYVVCVILLGSTIPMIILTLRNKKNKERA